MKTFLLISLLAASSLDATVFAYRQSASQSGDAALAFPSNNVAGNMIVVAVSQTVSAVSDTQSNTYSLVSAQSIGSPRLQIWVALGIKAGANSVTATGLAVAGAYSSIAIIEYTVPSSFAVAGTPGSTGTPNNGSATLYKSSAETLLVIAAYDFHSSHAWTGTNLTVRQTTTETGGQTMSIGDFDTATSTLATISTLNGCSLAASCLAASLLNFQTSTGTGTPSASAFVGLQ